MPPESIATKNLKKASGIAAKQMLAAVQKARKAFMADVTATLKKPSAWSATGRAALDAKADAIFRQQLVKALDATLNELSGTAATQGNAEARRQAGEAIPRFSKEYLEDYLSRVTPANAPSLAAVYTASMAESAKTALRQTAVSVFTVAAAVGLTTRERMKLFQAEWAERAKNDDPCRFVDKSGRRWENTRYVQMLARTTAQRVQTAAFCDSMLQGGFPLARISNDSGALTCDVCAQWQGRLIDLTPGHKLKGGTYTLSEAREAGVFHPNCTHRLEYVPIAEYPERLLAKVKGKLGEDNAFGKPSPSTHAGLPNKAQTEAHEKAVEEAAKKRAEKEAKARAAIGRRGTWKELGLPDGKDIPPDPAEPKISVAEAKERLAKGEEVTDPLGRGIHFGEKAAKHLGKKGRAIAEEEIRLTNLNRAEATIKNPHEIWRDESSGREKYVRFAKDRSSGKTVLNVVTEGGKDAYSWHSSAVSFNHYRRGELLYLRP